MTTQPKPKPLLCTVEEAAAELSVGITTLKKLIRHGELHSIKIGRARRVLRSSLDEYTQRLHIIQNEGAA